MRKTLLTGSLFTFLALLLAACMPAAQQQPQAATQPVSQQALTTANIKLETNPSPAQSGDVELLLNISDQNGNPIDGAKVNVSASHPDMQSMSMGGQASELGKGKYSIKANFNMNGSWKITVQVLKDTLNVKQELPLELK
jgi:hypothetical protein